MAKILVVEDDIDISQGIAEYMEILGHELDFAYTGKQALDMLNEQNWDMVLLDINLPELSGYEVCQSLLGGQLASLPVIMMSANQEEQDILKGFESGAWDYLTKPFSYAELNARVTVALSKINTSNTRGLKVGEFHLNTQSQSLSDSSGREVQLHGVGFSIVKVLMESSGRAVTSTKLIDTVWPDEVPSSNPLRSNIYSLRKQLQEGFGVELISTIKGMGYRFDVD